MIQPPVHEFRGAWLVESDEFDEFELDELDDELVGLPFALRNTQSLMTHQLISRITVCGSANAYV